MAAAISSVITLGTFDGVHRGHQAILRDVIRRAGRRKARSVVLAFGMPPRFMREPLREPVLLTTLEEKKDLLQSLGIHTLKLLTFDRKTANTSAEEFFEKMIVGHLKTVDMVVGPRVAFGRKRAGRLPLLRRLGPRHDVGIHVVPPVIVGGQSVSSRRIRALLMKGNVEQAAKLLGRPYSASGPVVHGDGRGRTLGYPTANIRIPVEKILPLGVFWVKAYAADGQAMDGLCNIGTRPTFTPKERHLHCEVFLFKKPSSLYGRKLTVVFLKKIRAEKRFRSAEALKEQIAKDFARAQKWAARISLQDKAIPV